MICEFCLQFQKDGKCALGLKVPRQMSCREFDPGIEKFCANPADFVSAEQIIQMGVFFGIKGMELKKIRRIATQEEQTRSKSSVKQ
ncbi:MAG TPA: hypothetical protein VNO70_22935 [Blastocatellia bacterium]|nr:hypothetical protein [Blastocatellia bacterium]